MAQSDLHEFIIKNSKSIKKRTDQSVKPGIHHLNIFSDINPASLQGDDLVEYFLTAFKIENDGHLYKKQLIDHVDKIDNPFFKTIVLCEVNYFNSAIQIIEELKKHFGMEVEVIGAQANYKEYNNKINDAIFIDIQDIENSNILSKRPHYKFETEKYSFIDQKIVPLNVKEQKLLILIIFYILKLSEIETHKKEQHFEFANAFLDRLLFIQNESFPNRDYILGHFKNLLRGELNEIEFLNKYDNELPFIPSFDYFRVLADNHFKKYNFESALQIYTILEQHLKMVKCYLGLNKEDEMKKELHRIRHQLEKKLLGSDPEYADLHLNSEVNKKNIEIGERPVLNTDEVRKQLNFENKMDQLEIDNDGPTHIENPITKSAESTTKDQKGTDISDLSLSEMKFALVNTYDLLAEITKDPSYYDKSYKLYQSHETLKNKALYLIRDQRITEAIDILQQALEHSQNDVKLFHMLGCLKIALNQNGEPELRKILSIDPDNYETLLNLADFKIQRNSNSEALDYLQKAFKIHQNEHVAKCIVTLLTKENRKDELEKFLSDNNALLDDESVEHKQE
ncbi:hypothetical protein M153_2500032247 [Pseudoloma neurophilia]|uniref:Uncharacterized protein n=1 Tax=Pseudoloma neurophilia TaxID=146866 RepID=A0A0R0MA33_9MICR|nr:hypothetical protein M153_2500032247 [Pseudoloma neurophilia]